MLTLFSQILFVNPVILSALAALPILWFLLRVTPPAPKTIDFPAMRFLEGLIPDQTTPAKTPWWLLLLRLLIAALVIFALSQPVYNPSRSLDGQDNLRLVITNDWASAQNWDLISNTAADILSQAERNKTAIEWMTTAGRAEGPESGLNLSRLMSAAEAEAELKALTPKPWGSDYAALGDYLRADTHTTPIRTLVLSSGLHEEGLEDFLAALRRRGHVHVLKMEAKNLPVALRGLGGAGGAPSAQVLTPAGLAAGVPLSVQARTQDGRILGAQNIQSAPDTATYDVAFDIPDVLRNNIGLYSVAGRASAATTYLLDERFRKRSVGIAGEDNTADSTASLTEAATYIKNALEPYTQLEFGTIGALLKKDVAMIILPDTGAIPSDTLNGLERWVKGGGLLLRFAGPKLTQSLNAPYLLPVPLRMSERALDGALSWEKPLKIKPFAATSPLYGIAVPEDVHIKQQVLAEPVQDLEQKTWAALEDGTPLMTAAQQGDGLVVLVHTTASPDWSNLPLSGLFVQILRRTVSLSGKAPAAVFTDHGALDPLYVLDGFGALVQPDAGTKPIASTAIGDIRISADNPPGIYGRGGVQKTLNLGDSLGEGITTIGRLPANIGVSEYGRDYELDLRPYLLYGAAALLIFDWLVMAMLSIGLNGWRLRRAAAAPLVLLVCALGVMPLMTAPACAQEPAQGQEQEQPQTANAPLTTLPEDQLRYADDLYLAYIKSGDSETDRVAEAGLNVLAQVLSRRTSAEPVGVVGLEPGSKALAFFPLLYWPVSAAAKALTAQEVENIQHYLDHGGTILFDTRDQNYTAGRVGGTPNAEALRQMVGNLNIPPLQAVPDDHVLTKSFYLLGSFPGLYNGGTLWVESDSASGRDGVSSVIIGSHDWAGSWAASASPASRNIYGRNKQEELSLRFGVNLMMYALTGNYKADQVHVPHILERLGK